MLEIEREYLKHGIRELSEELVEHQIPDPSALLPCAFRYSGLQGEVQALYFIVLPLPPRRAAVVGTQAYRKWRGAAPLRGR